VPEIARRMHEHIWPYSVPVQKHMGDFGEGWGSGGYLRFTGRIYILTNEHVARPREANQPLSHQLAGSENVYMVSGDHLAKRWPLDLALIPVSPQAWDTPDNRSKAITPRLIALAHDPVPSELLTFAGFSGDRSDFYFGTLVTRGNSSTAREVTLPTEDSRFKSRFHFGIDYRPDLATNVVGTAGLPRRPGFSGSLVWDTGFVSCRLKGEDWTPDKARVTGIVWGWPSSNACLVATRAEYIRSFLLATLDEQLAEPDHDNPEADTSVRAA
jgi:hypothetical protein